jgi:hypothetical protein
VLGKTGSLINIHLGSLPTFLTRDILLNTTHAKIVAVGEALRFYVVGIDMYIKIAGR